MRRGFIVYDIVKSSNAIDSLVVLVHLSHIFLSHSPSGNNWFITETGRRNCCLQIHYSIPFSCTTPHNHHWQRSERQTLLNLLVFLLRQYSINENPLQVPWIISQKSYCDRSRYQRFNASALLANAKPFAHFNLFIGKCVANAVIH